jgi:dihydrofolate reductase
MTAARPLVALVAALDRERAIGRDGALLWHDAEDQKHFRRVTMGSPVIMGRRTWDSLPERFRPLPGRRNIVLTRNDAWQAAGAERARSLDDAIAQVGDAARVFVIGGSEIYALALPRADELVLTEIDTTFDGADAHFPPFDRREWLKSSTEPHESPSGVRYAFVTYQRQRP